MTEPEAHDPMAQALAASLAEAALAVGVPVVWSCPDCYLTGDSREALGKQHEAERTELTVLRAEVAQLRQERDDNSAGWQEAETELALEGALHQVTKD